MAGGYQLGDVFGFDVVGSTTGDLGGPNAGGSDGYSDVFYAIYDGQSVTISQYGSEGDDEAEEQNQEDPACGPRNCARRDEERERPGAAGARCEVHR